MLFRIDAASLDAIDFTPVRPYSHGYYKYMVEPAGREHYRLLTHLARQCSPNDTLIDIGTHLGNSAIALAYGSTAKVITYDLVDHITAKLPPPNLHSFHPDRIDIRLENCLLELDKIAGSLLVVLDVDPHDGFQETEIIAALQSAGFRGLVVCDDIHLTDGMKAFWNRVTRKKLDVSRYGHWSGTGIIVFDESFADVALPVA